GLVPGLYYLGSLPWPRRTKSATQAIPTRTATETNAAGSVPPVEVIWKNPCEAEEMASHPTKSTRTRARLRMHQTVPRGFGLRVPFAILSWMPWQMTRTETL